MIIIEKATANDVPRLTTLINKAYRGASAQKGWTSEAHLLDGLRIDEATLTEYIADKDTAILKCSNNGEIAGCVYVKKEDDALYFGMLTVDPDRQNNGTGKLLLKHVAWYATEQHCSRIYMTVISVRSELISWYERLGFKRTGEIRPFPTDTKFGIQKQPLELITMEKQL